MEEKEWVEEEISQMFMHWNGGQKEICDSNSLQWQSQEFAAGHATYKNNQSRGDDYESTKNSLSQMFWCHSSQVSFIYRLLT
jgi:cell shape-determining protein MreC